MTPEQSERLADLKKKYWWIYIGNPAMIKFSKSRPFDLFELKHAADMLQSGGFKMCNHESSDPVNHPVHYTSLPGIECIDITENFNFCRGNAIKYIWRAGLKGDEIEDLKKAAWYLEREIKRLEAARCA